MIGLPEGWAIAELTELTTKIVDGSHNPPPGAEAGAPMLSARNIEGGSINFDKYRLISAEAFEREDARTGVVPGDVLLTIVGTIGRTAVVPPGVQKFTLQRSVAVLRTNDAVLPHYLRSYLEADEPQRWMLERAKGTAQKGIYLGTLAKLPCPIPPLAEQRRIVEKLGALTARTARVRDDLDRIPAIAARYKQAALAKALGGELTKDFFTESDQAEGPRAYADLGLDDQERGVWTFERLPAGWEWQSFSSILDDVTDSRRKLPTKDYQSTGRFPIVDQGEVAVPGFTDREEMLNLSPPPNIVFGDHTRCVKFVAEPFAQGADGVKVLKPRSNVEPRYAELLLRAVDIPAKGYSRHMKFLRASYFPVCGLALQQEIVRRVHRAFAEVDRLVAEAAAARRLLDRFDQALLAKAFRGELVSQNASDEPAEILLDRIRAERGGSPKRKRKLSPRTPATRKKTNMPKSRLDDDVKNRPFLASILKASGTALSADSLFESADLPITDFYKQLAWEIDNGLVRQRDETLEAA